MTIIPRPRRLAYVVRSLALGAVLCALVGGAGAFAADDDRDRIEFANDQKADGVVSTEGSDETRFKTTPTSAEQHPKTRTIRRIVYAGMVNDGPWRKAMEAKDRGKFAEAADIFASMADGGGREWEKFYGAMQEGDCWEQAKKYADAVKAFHKVVDTAKFDQDDKAQPRQRLWLEAAYRLGVALAESGDADGANKLADSLDAYGNLRGSTNSSAAQTRANAVRAAIAAVAKDQTKLADFSQKVVLRAADGDTWVHFNLMMAGAYSQAGKPKEAAAILDELLDGLANDPPRRAQAMLLKALTLIDSDPQAALVELIRIDVLPYGSEDQKCVARYQAGRILKDLADKLKANATAMKDDRKAAFVDEQIATARLLLTAAAGSLSEVPEKGKAKDLLDQLPKDPDAPADATAAAPADGATDAAPKN
jgi:hypothetical protein